MLGIERDMPLADRQRLNHMLAVMVIMGGLCCATLAFISLPSLAVTLPFVVFFGYCLYRNNHIGYMQERYRRHVNRKHNEFITLAFEKKINVRKERGKDNV